MPIALWNELALREDALLATQRQKLAAQWPTLLHNNAFQRRRLLAAGCAKWDPLVDPLSALPLTTRPELEQDQRDHPPYGSNLTYPPQRYTRLHQTSGSRGGAPLRWPDTPESWQWWKECWACVYHGADLAPHERILFTFSFGPFIGFWSAFDAAGMLGHLCLPAGGMSTAARLRLILDHEATVVCCTPTYALHLAETAQQLGIDLRRSHVRRLIVAGEPGGNIPSVRARIASAWSAATQVIDHAGMTEIGAWGFEPARRAPGAPQPDGLQEPGGLHVIESAFIAEVIDPDSSQPVADGALGELVLTNLGRTGSPLLRYRTGDLVRLSRYDQRGNPQLAWCAGGVLGRRDDMLIIRGNNVFPGAVEDLIRGFGEIAEFRMVVAQRGALSDLQIDIEPAPHVAQHAAPQLCDRVADACKDRLHFRPTVRAVPPGTLPRFEMKAQRVIRAPQDAP